MGATAIRMPVLEIRPIAAALEIAAAPVSSRFDIAIFTSANAVQYGAPLAHAASELGAIGPATARALAERGLEVTISPVGEFDSEHLLRHPRLENPRGKRILIVKGRQGRVVLRDSLAARGAGVVVAEVYERVRVRYDSAQLSSLLAQCRDCGLDLVTATSAEVAAALMAIATPALRNELHLATWLVPGTRVAEAVRAQGVAAPIVEALSADDHALLDAVIRWHSNPSGTGT